MRYSNCLSTRTERFCPRCGQEFVLADPTDVLAERPVEVRLTCPDCDFQGRATLTNDQVFHSTVPCPETPRSRSNEEQQEFLTEHAYDPLPRIVRHGRLPEFDDFLPLDPVK